MNSLLFVDDDPMVLRAMSRSFSHDYNVNVAQGGAEALEILRSGAKFEVVVTDHNMPEMTGVDFVTRARTIADQPRYLMLTGNRDVDVATAAVNDGEVYRLLHKPCDDDTLARAIRDAAENHAVEQARQQLLHKTFVGGIGVVASLLESALPEFAGIGSGTVDRVELLRDSVGIRERWEYKIAARLCLIGFASKHDKGAKGRWRGPDAVAENLDAFREATRAGADQLATIPNLGLAAAMIRDFPDADGTICSFNPQSDAAVQSVGANLLRVGLLAEMLMREGVGVAAMAQEVRGLLPDINDRLVSALAEMPEDNSEPEGVSVSLRDLHPGMVLAREVTGPGGASLLRSRTRLSAIHVSNLQDAYDSKRVDGSVTVTAVSHGAFGD